jgi:allantoinase
MSLPDEFLQYPKRRHGMDHDRYAWSMLTERRPVQWPDARPLAVWINVCVEHFPLDPRGEGLKPHGAMTMPYPDLRHYTLRDYGNRVGIYRVLDALAGRGLTASIAAQAEVITRYPALARELRATGFEWLGHGWNMDRLHHGGIDPETERALVADSLQVLRAAAPGPVRGWLSPARSQSAQTPELLRAAGIDWCADWVNDELPYRFATEHGALTALPLSLELEDRFVIGENLHGESEWADQVTDAIEFLLDEATTQTAGRLVTLNLHPWVIGQPHRIRHLERVLECLSRHRDAIWNASPSMIVDHHAQFITATS